jgi:hypothetical protein
MKCVAIGSSSMVDASTALAARSSASAGTDGGGWALESLLLASCDGGGAASGAGGWREQATATREATAGKERQRT